MSIGSSPRVRLSEEKLARAALTYLAEPGDPALGALLAICSPAEVLAAIKADMLPRTGPGCGDTPASQAALDRALGRWRARLPTLPHEERLADTSRDGIRLSCPGDPDWPAETNDPRLGGLYVLRRDAMLRLAAGGEQTKAEKLRRLKLLARKALSRL